MYLYKKKHIYIYINKSFKYHPDCSGMPKAHPLRLTRILLENKLYMYSYKKIFKCFGYKAYSCHYRHKVLKAHPWDSLLHSMLYANSWDNSMSRIKQTQFSPFTVIIIDIWCYHHTINSLIVALIMWRLINVTINTLMWSNNHYFSTSMAISSFQTEFVYYYRFSELPGIDLFICFKNTPV